MKGIMSILLMVLLMFSAVPVLAEEAGTSDAVDTADTTDTVDVTDTTNTGETPVEETPIEVVGNATEENTVNPDSPVLYRLELLGEKINSIFMNKIKRAEYRLARIKERQQEMEEMSAKYQKKIEQAEKYIEKARQNMEKHMQRITAEMQSINESEKGEIKYGLEKSRERLLMLLARKPDSKGLKRALETHDINIEKLRLRLTRENGEEEETPEEEGEEGEEEETPEEEGEEAEGETVRVQSAKGKSSSSSGKGGKAE